MIIQHKPASNTASATGSGVITDSEPENDETIQPDTGTSIIEHVDFDQWLNLDICEDVNVPSMSMLWDFPDYGSNNKPGNDDGLEVFSQPTNASFWNSTDHTNVVSHRIELDPDIALNNDHDTDSSDDRPGASLSVAKTRIINLWDEVSDAEVYSQSSFEDNSPPWTPHPRASNKRRRSDEQSTFDDFPPLDDKTGPFSSLGVGAAALFNTFSEQKKKRKRRKIASEFGDSHDTTRQPNTRPISQEGLVEQVRETHAGLVMVEAKCLEVDNKQHKMLVKDENINIRDRVIWTGVARVWDKNVTTIMRTDQKNDYQMQQVLKSSRDFEPRSRDPEPSETSLDTLSQFATSSQNFLSPKSTKPDASHVACNASSARLCEPRKHVKYHAKPLTCPDANCTHSSARQRDLKRHHKAARKGTHEPEQLLCPHEVCRSNGVVFGRRDNLLRHMRRLRSADEAGEGGSEAEWRQDDDNTSP